MMEDIVKTCIFGPITFLKKSITGYMKQTNTINKFVLENDEITKKRNKNNKNNVVAEENKLYFL